MDVSGQSMLPMAGLAALILPGWWKLGALIVVVLAFVVALNRLVFRPQRAAGARHRLTPRRPAPRRPDDLVTSGRHRAR